MGGRTIAKLFTMFMVLIAIQFCLILYTDGYVENTAVWSFVTNMDNWNLSSFLVVLTGVAASAALIGIASGGTFRFVTDFLVWTPAVIGLGAIGVVFTQLAGIVRSELMARFFTTCMTNQTDFIKAAQGCTPATYLTAVLIGPFALYYIWTVIEWWRGKDI